RTKGAVARRLASAFNRRHDVRARATMESPSLRELSDLLLNRLAGAWAALAHDQRLQLLELDEIVGLAPQLVGDHGRLRPDRGHDADAASFFLCGLDEAAKIAVAGKDHDVIHG